MMHSIIPDGKGGYIALHEGDKQSEDLIETINRLKQSIADRYIKEWKEYIEKEYPKTIKIEKTEDCEYAGLGDTITIMTKEQAEKMFNIGDNGQGT